MEVNKKSKLIWIASLAIMFASVLISFCIRVKTGDVTCANTTMGLGILLGLCMYCVSVYIRKKEYGSL